VRLKAHQGAHQDTHQACVACRRDRHETGRPGSLSSNRDAAPTGANDGGRAMNNRRPRGVQTWRSFRASESTLAVRRRGKPEGTPRPVQVGHPQLLAIPRPRCRTRLAGGSSAPGRRRASPCSTRRTALRGVDRKHTKKPTRPCPASTMHRCTNLATSSTTTVNRQQLGRLDERAPMSISITETSDERRVSNAQHDEHAVHDSTSNRRTPSRATCGSTLAPQRADRGDQLTRTSKPALQPSGLARGARRCCRIRGPRS
jgi:hypothetical protein